MRQHFDLIVFDWDGTLMDSAALIVASVQAAARDLGLEPPSEARARHIIGLGLNDALRHALPDLPEAHYPELVARYRHHYLSRDHELTLFEGAAELVRELADGGYRL
ncbi:MAG: HAD family hydrolase, partial [Rhodocyclaceae bacterium]